MIDPDVARFVAESEAFYPPGTAQLAIADQRRLYEDYARAFAVQRPAGVTSEDGALVLSDRTIPLRLYRPGRTHAGDSVVVYAHGGGFMLGSLDSHDGIVARAADAIGARVIAVDYRLAPEHRYAAALSDIVEVAHAILEGRSPWPELPQHRLGLMGDSAGGTLACIAALRLGRATSDRLRALALIYPMLGYEPAEPARTLWANAPMLTLEEVRFYRAVAMGDHGGDAVFPLDQPELAALPPTVLLPAEIDPLRDDCTALAARLKRAGQEVRLLPGTGLVHGALRTLDRAPAMSDAFNRMCEYMSAWLGE